MHGGGVVRLGRQQKADGKDGRPRDEFLRPMIDTIGIQNRLSLDAANTEDKVREEFEANQYESRMGIQFAGKFVRFFFWSFFLGFVFLSPPPQAPSPPIRMLGVKCCP